LQFSWPLCKNCNAVDPCVKLQFSWPMCKIAIFLSPIPMQKLQFSWPMFKNCNRSCKLQLQKLQFFCCWPLSCGKIANCSLVLSWLGKLGRDNLDTKMRLNGLKCVQNSNLFTSRLQISRHIFGSRSQQTLGNYLGNKSQQTWATNPKSYANLGLGARLGSGSLGIAS